MPIVAQTFDPFTPDRVARADEAWKTYQAARRRIWTYAPHLERQFFKTHDIESYARGRHLIVTVANRAHRGWLASIRKIFGSDAWVEAVGTTHIGMPQCYLARVPQPGRRALIVAERRWGAPPPHDVVGQERILAERRARAAEYEQARRGERHAVYHMKMMASLLQSRIELALVTRYRARRGATKVSHPEIREVLVREVAKARSRYRDYVERAARYQAKLLDLGYSYDFGTIDTPFTLPEEEPIHELIQRAAAAPHIHDPTAGGDGVA